MSEDIQQSSPLISVIVPIFNVESYLETALDSLRQQSMYDIEIIAVDDCSSDNSRQILQHKASIDTRIVTVLSAQNGGLSRTRNLGIAQAKGKWIAFLDSDDYLRPEALQTWYQQAESCQADLLLGNGFRFEHFPDLPWGKSIRNEQGWPGVISGAQWIIDAVKEKQWNHFSWLNFVRRELLQASGALFKEDLLHEDILMTTALALAADRVTYCGVPFYGYRQRQTSIIQSAAEQMRIHRARSYLYIINTLFAMGKEQKNPKLRRALCNQAVQEVGVVMGIMRKKISDSYQLKGLASLYMSHKETWKLLSVCSNVHEIFRILKFHYLCRKIISRGY